jgi:hypothetical protein
MKHLTVASGARLVRDSFQSEVIEALRGDFIEALEEMPVRV